MGSEGEELKEEEEEEKETEAEKEEESDELGENTGRIPNTEL